ncbi:MAG: fibronectin type III domain-containing protein, partial [Actinomycetota bacterium]|nr:fibronectin type III domain-containing protein [Actinomycetota bacterium]
STPGVSTITAKLGETTIGTITLSSTQVTDRVRFSEVAVASSTLTAGGSSTTVTVTLKSGASTALSESAGTVALFSSAGSFGVVSDAADGTYTASFAPPTTAGRYVIWATLDGLTLSRTAVVTVEAGAAVASTSSVSADRFSLPADGTSTGSIIVTLRDAYGNVLDGSADVESVGVAVSGGGSVGASTATKQDNGTYAVTYTAAAAVSTGVVTATLDPSGTPTTIGSLSISNTPVTAIGQYSTLSADAASVQVGGSAVTVSVQLRDGDGAGNNTSSAGVFALYSSGGLISVTSNSLSSNGALEASFTPPSSTGPVTIWATLDGQALSASTTVTVIPGVASASTSSVTVDRFSLPADGVSTGTIIVTLRDASGNALGGSADSETVTMTVSGGGSVGTATKQGDGTYAATFTAPSTPGVSTITAKLGETTIGTITLSSTQVTDRVRYSTVTSSSDTFTAGGTGPTITVTLKSDASTPLTASGGRVALHSAAGSLGAVTDVGNGTYTATFDPPDTAGDVVVWATLDGLVLEDVAVITVQPAAASAAASSVSVARTVLPADRASSTTVTITVRDVYGNVRTAGGDDGDITLTVTGDGSIGSVNDNGDGTYSATFTSVASVGTSVVAAQINAVSAGSVSVLRTRVSEVTSTSTLSVSSSTTTAGGSMVTATVQLADSGGIITTDVGDVVIRTTAGSVGSTSFLSGIYSAAVTPPTSTGTVLVWATIDGVALSASATITVNPGSASTGASVVTASSTSLSADGSSTSTITVALRDAYANPLTASGGTVVVSVASGSGSVGSVTNNSNGTYTATYTAGYVAGVVRIEATVGGSKIADAAFITLTSGTATAAQTTIDVSDSSFVADGSSTVTVTVRPRDASGNLVTTGSHTIVVSSTAGTIADSGAPTRQEDGSYTVTLTSPTTTGTATVTATLGGVAITDTASVRAVAGSPSTSTSTVSVADDSLTADGSSTTTVTVRLQDANSNPIVIGGATVAVTVTGEGSTGSVTDNRDGSYTATYTAGSSSGSVTISATVGGSSITDTATITLSAAATAPDAPTDLVGTPGVRSVSLTWTAPTSDGGATITDYIVEYSSNSGSNWTTFADGTSASTRATVTGLTDGTEYTFRVSAVNSAGTGTASATETVTPGVPGTPTSFAAADGADGTATLTWSAPSSGGSDIIRYVVSYSSDSGSTWSAEAAAVSGDSLTLADGTYEVRVRAENAAGFGEYATDSVTVTGTPPSPP